MDVDMGPPPFVVGQACASAGWPATVRIAPNTPESSVHNMPFEERRSWDGEGATRL